MGDVYGVTPQGFVVKPLDQCLSELEDLAKGTFGKGIKLNASSKWGQFLGVLSERESELWDAMQHVHAARDPDQATDADLDAICAISGILRRAAVGSRLTNVVLGGTNGSVISVGKVASVIATRVRFALEADVVLAPAGAWAQGLPYAIGARRSANGNVYEAVVNGVSAGAGAGPAGTGQDIVDGTVHWKYLGAGDAVGLGNFTAVDTGPLPAPTGTLTGIETPVSGWAWVVNEADAVLGRDQETNALLRVRREQTLAIAGSAAPDAIRAEISRVVGVTAVTVFYNDDDVANADGMPPHSVEAMVSGGDDAAIAAAIWKSKAAGIRPWGGVTVAVLDAAGLPQDVRFSRPTIVPIYLAITVSVDENYSTEDAPYDGDSLVAAAVVAWGQAHLAGGVDLHPRMLIAPIAGIAGVYDVPHVYAGLAPAPGGEGAVAISSRQVAQVDTARITIAHA